MKFLKTAKKSLLCHRGHYFCDTPTSVLVVYRSGEF